MRKSIYEYGKAKKLIPRVNKAEKEISAYLVLNDDGTLKYIDNIPKKDRKKVMCPDIGNLQYVNYANPICEKIKYILFGAAPEHLEDCTSKAIQKHEAWRSIMHDGAQHNESMRVIDTFLDRLENNTEQKVELYQQLCSGDSEKKGKSRNKEEKMISFRVFGKNVEQDNTWEEWFNDWIKQNTKSTDDGEDDNSNKKAISCITGESVIPIRKASFPKVQTSQTGTGAYLASYNQPCLVSYGISDSSAAPVSPDEANTMHAAIEYLLKSPNHHSDRFNIIYWYKNEDNEDVNNELFDVIGELASYVPSDEEENEEKRSEELSNLLGRFSEKSKEFTEGCKNAKYHLMSFCVSSPGRLFFWNEEEGSYGDMLCATEKWLKDTAMVLPILVKEEDKYIVTGYAERSVKNVYSILYAFLHNKDADDKSKQIKKEYGANRLNLFLSAIKGTQVPHDIFIRALMEADKVMIKKTKLWRYELALQVMKAYLIRTNKEEYRNMESNLNKDTNSAGYQLGRLLAKAEKIQYTASPGTINKDIAMRFGKLAKEKPNTAIVKISESVQAYINKIENQEHKGLASKLLNEYNSIAVKLTSCLDGAAFSGRLTNEERAAFYLGYSAQQFYDREELLKNIDKNKNSQKKQVNPTTGETDQSQQPNNA